MVSTSMEYLKSLQINNREKEIIIFGNGDAYTFIRVDPNEPAEVTLVELAKIANNVRFNPIGYGRKS